MSSDGQIQYGIPCIFSQRIIETNGTLGKRRPSILDTAAMSLRYIFLTVLLPINLVTVTAFAQDAPTAIQVFVSDGEGAINTARQRMAKDPVVVVEDQDHRP